MESGLEAIFQKRDQRKSITLVSNQIEEGNDNQLNDTHVDRSRQRQLFEQQTNQLHQSHHGDQDIQENSFQDRTNSTILELQPQSSGDVSLQASFIQEIKQAPFTNQDHNDEIKCNIEFQDEGESQKNENQQTNKQIDIFSECDQKVLKGQLSIMNPSNLNFNIQNTQNYSNIIGNQQTLAECANSSIQQKKCIKSEISDKIWLQEDILYEKNYKKLGTKVTLALKSQYLEQQQLNGISDKKKRFNYIFTLTENQKHIIKLINQIISVMTVAHIAAIGWYFLGIQEKQNNHSNWLVKIGIQDQAYYEKYAYSIYWSITTMTTGIYLTQYIIQVFKYSYQVGYGDIAATNYIEALYISVTMILFSCVFAYSINNIGFILQEIEKSSKQLNDDITIIQRYSIKKNLEIFDTLKQNLKQKDDQCYLLFESNENLLSSENSQSKYQNDEDEEDESLSQIELYLDHQQSHNSLNFSKAFLRKKTDKKLKSIIKTNNFYQQNPQVNESLANLENQSYSNKSLNNQENVEFKRVASNTQCTYVKTQTFDAIESINNNSMKQESSCNTISNMQANEYNRTIYKNDPEYFNQNIEIYNQLQNQEDEDRLVKQKSTQQTVSFLNVLQSDQEKKQLKQGQYANKISQQQTEDYNQMQNKESQIQQPSFTDTQSKTFTKKSKTRHSVSQKSIKLQNQSQKDLQFPVDQILQHIITNNLISDQRIIQQKQSRNCPSFLQDILENNLSNSEKSIKEYKEKMNSQNSLLSQILFYNSNQKDQKQNLQNNKQEIQQNQQKNLNNHHASEIDLIKKLSRIFQKTSLPLLMQLANGKNSLKAENILLSDLMDQFDKLQQFKKYFPHNNFQKVIQNQKKFQYDQKKQKKNKLAAKQRRQNIGLVDITRLSIFNGSPNFIKLIPQDYDINLYKPTYLSYGVKMQNGINFPISFQSNSKY
ncbi:hypothetical protein ABPG74_004821 [Tetrahymena malaccensis]